MSKLVNGSGFAALSPAQQACVELLEEALGEARDGKVVSVGIILCMKGGYAAVMAGADAADLNLGCDSLKRKIMAAVEEESSSSSVVDPSP